MKTTFDTTSAMMSPMMKDMIRLRTCFMPVATTYPLYISITVHMVAAIRTTSASTATSTSAVVTLPVCGCSIARSVRYCSTLRTPAGKQTIAMRRYGHRARACVPSISMNLNRDGARIAPKTCNVSAMHSHAFNPSATKSHNGPAFPK